jgi:hypothetical protein
VLGAPAAGLRADDEAAHAAPHAAAACTYRLDVQTSDLPGSQLAGAVSVALLGERARAGPFELRGGGGAGFARGALDSFLLEGLPDLGAVQEARPAVRAGSGSVCGNWADCLFYSVFCAQASRPRWPSVPPCCWPCLLLGRTAGTLTLFKGQGTPTALHI